MRVPNVKFWSARQRGVEVGRAHRCRAGYNDVADGGRRKLSVVTDGTPEKGRRYLTFTHIERALVAIFNLNNFIN